MSEFVEAFDRIKFDVQETVRPLWDEGHKAGRASMKAEAAKVLNDLCYNSDEGVIVDFSPARQRILALED